MQATEYTKATPPAAWSVSLFVTLLGLWMGAAMFFSGGVLPVLFTRLPPSEAGGIAALLFPVYFWASLVVGSCCCLSSLLVGRGGGRRWRVVTLILLAMTLAQAWSTLVISPEMALIRGVPEQVARFQALHQLSVRLNGGILLGGMLLLGASGSLFTRRDV